MAKDREQIVRELEELKGEVQSLKPPPKEEQNTEESVTTLMRYMIEERERTNRRLNEINEKILGLRSAVESLYAPKEQSSQSDAESAEVLLSDIDSSVLNFLHSRGMICADDLKEFMQYRGRNGACARLNQLYKRGLLERHQLGHKVYYRYAGKATKTLIISPPQ